MTRHYPVIYEWSGRNFSGYAPDVAGCIATAKTLPAMRLALRGALEAHLHWLNKQGDRIPEASDKVRLDLAPDAEFPPPAGYYVVVERLDVQLPRVRQSRKLSSTKPVSSRRRSLQAA